MTQQCTSKHFIHVRACFLFVVVFFFFVFFIYLFFCFACGERPVSSQMMYSFKLMPLITVEPRVTNPLGNGGCSFNMRRKSFHIISYLCVVILTEYIVV